MKNIGSYVLAAVCAWPLITAAQQPRFVHAQLSTRSGGDLQQAIVEAKAPVWIGYSERTAHSMKSNWNNEVTYLEDRPSVHWSDDAPATSTEATSMVVLLRVADGHVSKVSIADPERTIDAGNMPVIWLNDVRPEASLHALSAFVQQGAAGSTSPSSENGTTYASARGTSVAALTAIALHNALEATATLRDFTSEQNPTWLRERAAFWLAVERGSEGFQVIKTLLQNDHDDDLRTKLVFDLTLVKSSSHTEALDELLALARTDSSPRVRKQAQFWLAQEASHKAAGDSRIPKALSDEAEHDPEQAIRKSAVFAISRLPQEQATTQLVALASTAKDPGVRREAIFWLGQSKDPRALAYLEKVARE